MILSTAANLQQNVWGKRMKVKAQTSTDFNEMLWNINQWPQQKQDFDYFDISLWILWSSGNKNSFLTSDLREPVSSLSI